MKSARRSVSFKSSAPRTCGWELEAREEGIGRELGEKMRADFQEGQDTILRTDCGGLNTRLEALVKLGYLLRGGLSDADPLL